MNVLVVEDDDRVRHALRSALRRRGAYVVALGGEEGLWGHLAAADVVLLDLGLPDVDGFQLCRRIREAADVPIIVVTARSDVADRVTGLYCGADDYLVKPFNVPELAARIEAVLRRSRPARPDPDLANPPCGVVLDSARHTAVVAGEELPLTPKEFDILALLTAAGGAVCSRRRIVLAVWGQDSGRAGHSLDVHIAALRAKLGEPGAIQTVHGVGYRIALV